LPAAGQRVARDLHQRVQQEIRAELGADPRQGGDGVVGQDRIRALQCDVAGVEARVDPVHGDAAFGVALHEGPEVREETAMPRQERAVDVQRSVGGDGAQRRADALVEIHRDEKIGSPTGDAREHRRRVHVLGADERQAGAARQVGERGHRRRAARDPAPRPRGTAEGELEGLPSHESEAGMTQKKPATACSALAGDDRVRADDACHLAGVAREHATGDQVRLWALVGEDRDPWRHRFRVVADDVLRTYART
jgi:hypothetical protein